MIEIKDLPFREKWPLLHRLIHKGIPVMLVAGAIMGSLALYLWFIGGAQPVTHTTTTVTDGIQTRITTSTVNLFAQTLFNYLALPSLCLVALPIEMYVLVVLPHTRLNTESEVEE
jgi:hypothetical protein